MGDADITTSQWKNVEVGRVVLFTGGEYYGKIAAIAEIIDHKRVLVDGPASKKEMVVPRHSAPLNQIKLMPQIIKDLPNGTGNGPLRKRWEAQEIEKQVEEGPWSQSKKRMDKRRALNDFERFKVMKMRKQARYEVARTFAKIKSDAKA